MSLTIDLTPAEEGRLVARARREGVDPTILARRLVQEGLQSTPPEDPSDPMLALFARWDAEDARMTAEEVAEANRQWEELKANLNAERDRAGSRRLF
ncbi:MAG TPA: hypothetical protein VFJ58_28100 [Armatimonadota bacterium]|nr:hypothetical protein [Armatimonadota bacterium]